MHPHAREGFREAAFRGVGLASAPRGTPRAMWLRPPQPLTPFGWRASKLRCSRDESSTRALLDLSYRDVGFQLCASVSYQGNTGLESRRAPRASWIKLQPLLQLFQSPWPSATRCTFISFRPLLGIGREPNLQSSLEVFREYLLFKESK